MLARVLSGSARLAASRLSALSPHAPARVSGIVIYRMGMSYQSQREGRRDGYSHRDFQAPNPVLLNRQINDVFSDRKYDPLKWIDANIDYLDMMHIATILRVGSKSKYKLDPDYLVRLADLISKESIPAYEESKVLSGLLYGLKIYTHMDGGIPVLLNAIREKVAQTVSSLDSQFFGNALYGMQHMSSSEPAVRAIVAEIARKLYLSQGELDAQAIGNALYGLQSMNNDYPEINEVLQALSAKLSTCHDYMKAMHISNALYGLKSMTTVTPELEGLFTHLIPCMQRCSESYTSQNIGSAYFGFSSLTSFSSPALRGLLLALNDALAAMSPESLDERAMMTVFQGLAGADSAYKEVRVTLETVRKHLRQGKKEFSAQEVCRILGSLTNKHSEHKEVRDMITALAYRMRQSYGRRVRHQDVPIIVSGLRNLSSDSEEIEKLLMTLMKAFPDALTKQVVDKLDHVYSASDMVLMIQGLRSISAKNDIGALFITRILNLFGLYINDPNHKISWRVSPIEVVAALDGLHGRHAGDAIVQDLLKVIAHMIKKCPFPSGAFPSNELLRSMSCLGTLSSPPPGPDGIAAVNVLLSAVVPRITSGKGTPVGFSNSKPLTLEELGSLVSGLKDMDFGYKDSQSLLRVVKRLSLSDSLSSEALCLFLSGMKSMDWRDSAVSGLLRKLVAEVKDTEGNVANAIESKISEKLFLSSLSGCRGLNSSNEEGGRLLQRLANISVQTEVHESSDYSDRCAALVGLRRFCDQAINAPKAENTASQIDHICTVTNNVLRAFRNLDSAEKLLSPLHYGSILIACTNLVELLVSSDTKSSTAEDVKLLLTRLENVITHGRNALAHWQSQLAVIQSDAAGVYQKRPPVTSSDVRILRESLHVALAVFCRLSKDLPQHLVPVYGDHLLRLSQICDQSLSQVDSKRQTVNSVGNDDDEDNVEELIDVESSRTDKERDGEEITLRVEGLTYAEKKSSKLRRKFRNKLAEDCLAFNRDVIVVKVNPAVANIFSTDIILAYDVDGTDLAISLDMDVRMPYHHLLNPDLFQIYTDGNSSTLRNIVLDVEKVSKMYSSDCGLDAEVLRAFKLRFLESTYGADSVGRIWTDEEIKREEKYKKAGLQQLSVEELKKKKLVFFTVSNNDFEQMNTTKVLYSIMSKFQFQKNESKETVENTVAKENDHDEDLTFEAPPRSTIQE